MTSVRFNFLETLQSNFENNDNMAAEYIFTVTKTPLYCNTGPSSSVTVKEQGLQIHETEWMCITIKKNFASYDLNKKEKMKPNSSWIAKEYKKFQLSVLCDINNTGSPRKTEGRRSIPKCPHEHPFYQKWLSLRKVRIKRIESHLNIYTTHNYNSWWSRNIQDVFSLGCWLTLVFINAITSF